MKLSPPEVQLLIDLYVAGGMAGRLKGQDIRDKPEKHLMALIFALIDEAKEEGSTVSFSLLGSLLPKNLEKAEEFLHGELIPSE